ncbi:MarR family transcriptional regulator [Nocardia elegans]|uniref:MarR family winged helix-turn-helix transcriptional regulator n=1 Tax=Nocardia elegans TaxID=300029 RepID=UPI00189615C0|nr:MarR family transcriptional regulator [Nocardia elegans]MBF6245673.1 MarR family transcriptional regulator [Nocardia elegans]
MSDEELRAVRESAARINELIVDLWIATERSGPRYDEFELTAQQHAVLSLIVSQPGMTPRALSDALAVTKGAISQHLGVLEREGYISRQRSERDRRVQVLHLEKRGREYRDSLQRFERYAVDRYVATLSSSDIAEIITALTKLKSAFEE